MTTKVIRLKELTALLGISRASVYRLISQNILPKPFKISVSAIGWDATDIDAYIASRKQAAQA